MPLIKPHSIDAVVAATDMAEILAPYTHLRRVGTNLVGLCPFHEESTPSFSVQPQDKIYYCFGCGASGNVFGFLEAKENLTFTQATEVLARRYGISLEYEEATGGGSPGTGHLYALLEKAAGYYERLLWNEPSGASARSYLEKRDISGDIARRYRLGYAPKERRSLHRAARQAGFSERELHDAGLIVKTPRGIADRFRDRLIFPFVDATGRVLGFGARSLGSDHPKYLNSPETAAYRKGRLLYGLYQARQAIAREGRVIVMEGYTDVLAACQAGIEPVVGSMGTALTSAQFEQLRRLGKVFLALDGDEAGRKATVRALPLAHSAGISPGVIEMPAGQDPAEFIAAHGAPAFLALGDEAPRLLKYTIDKLIDGADIQSGEGRSKLLSDLRPLLDYAADELERLEAVRGIADVLALDETVVRGLLSKALPRAGRSVPAPTGGSSRAVYAQQELEETFLTALLALPEGRERFLDLTPEDFIHPDLFNAYSSLKSNPNPFEEPSPTFSRLKVRSGQQSATPMLVESLYLHLRERALAREIARLKERYESQKIPEEALALYRSYMEKEFARRELHEALAQLVEE